MRSKTVLLVATALLVSACAGSTQPQNWVRDVKDSGERLLNREVDLRGQTTDPRPEYPGSTKGVFTLIDDSDNEGLIVTSKRLPAPGEQCRVQGMVSRDRTNASLVVVTEMSRSCGGLQPLVIVMIVAGALAVVLLIALIVTLIRGNRPAATTGYPYQPPTQGGPAGQASSFDPPATVPFTPYQSAAKTEAFNFLGATLEIAEGPDVGKSYPLGVSPTMIGRTGGRQNHVTLSDSTVSLSQASVRKESDGKFVLINESRTNRTMVNDSLVDSAELQDGSRIRMGATVIAFRKSR